jgi:hypothetical protein
VFVDSELRAARAAGEKVVILGHIPPGARVHCQLPRLLCRS